LNSLELSTRVYVLRPIYTVGSDGFSITRPARTYHTTRTNHAISKKLTTRRLSSSNHQLYINVCVHGLFKLRNVLGGRLARNGGAGFTTCSSYKWREQITSNARGLGTTTCRRQTIVDRTAADVETHRIHTERQRPRFVHRTRTPTDNRSVLMSDGRRAKSTWTRRTCYNVITDVRARLVSVYRFRARKTASGTRVKFIFGRVILWGRRRRRVE